MKKAHDIATLQWLRTMTYETPHIVQAFTNPKGT
jgi:hypothetical protein